MFPVSTVKTAGHKLQVIRRSVKSGQIARQQGKSHVINKTSPVKSCSSSCSRRCLIAGRRSRTLTAGSLPTWPDSRQPPRCARMVWVGGGGECLVSREPMQWKCAEMNVLFLPILEFKSCNDKFGDIQLSQLCYCGNRRAVTERVKHCSLAGVSSSQCGRTFNNKFQRGKKR